MVDDKGAFGFVVFGEDAILLGPPPALWLLLLDGLDENVVFWGPDTYEYDDESLSAPIFFLEVGERTDGET